MIDFIASERRALRLPIRYSARVEQDGVRFDGHTEDVGARGCRLVTPARLATGSHLRLVLRSEGPAAPLWVGAVVVWREDGPLCRQGAAFDAGDRQRAGVWFDELAGRHTELFHLDRVPDRLRLGALVYVARPPETLPRIGEEEAVVLRLACDRTTVSDVCSAFGPDSWRARRALFSLLGRGALTLDEAEEGDRQVWRGHLDRHAWRGHLEASQHGPGG